MIRFAEVGWSNMNNENPVNVPHTALLPPSVQVSQAKQRRKTPRETAAATLPRRHTRSMTTDAARKAVFNTSELLENIVSFLPPRDILTKIPRLSRQWKTVAETSPTVGNKLWMASYKAPAIQSIGFTDEHMSGDPTWQGARPMYSCALTLNAVVLNTTFYAKGSHAFQVGWKNWQEVDNHGTAWSFSTIPFYCHIKESFQQTGPALSPTWRSMQLTDPPITMGMLELHPGPLAIHGPDDVYLHLTNNTGITLGLLYDTIFETFETQSAVSMTFGDVEHFMASLHFVSTSPLLSTSILHLE